MLKTCELVQVYDDYSMKRQMQQNNVSYLMQEESELKTTQGVADHPEQSI